MPDHSFSLEIFPKIQLKRTLAQFEVVSIVLSLVTWEKRPTPASLQPAVGFATLWDAFFRSELVAVLELAELVSSS